VATGKEELKKLLALYRKGIISEEILVEEIREIDQERAAAHPDAFDTEPEEQLALVDTLDAYRAAEESGAQTLLTWARLSTDPALVGGLRTAAAREAKHALLLEQRLRELGAEPKALIPDWLDAFNARITALGATDLDRLRLIVQRFPDIEEAVAPMFDLIELIARTDPLTSELLRTICVDEVSTLEWAHDAYNDRNEIVEEADF
jgi:hypothetical protein